MKWEKVDEAMAKASVAEAGMAERQPYVFPGGVLLVSRGDEVVYHKAFGCRSLDPVDAVATIDTVYDVASLTKPLVTTTLIMKLVGPQLLTVDYRLSRFFQSFASHGKERITVRHLLNHSSGYPSSVPFFRLIADADATHRQGVMTSRAAAELVYTEIFRSRLEALPGRGANYSDVGFILLGRVVEVVSGGMPLDRIAQREIFQPLGLRSTGFIELEKLRRRGLEPRHDVIAPTNRCEWRRKLIWGEVQDENAWAMGGIAGHAGLFSTAAEVYAIARALVNSWHGRNDFVRREVIREFWQRDESVPGSTWALGWDTPSAEGSSAGRRFSRQGVGHLGYTGTSLWIDPERELIVVLLTNRVHPSAANEAIKEFRPQLHELVMDAVMSGQ